MFTQAKVKHVWKYRLTKATVINYDDVDGFEKSAACVENLNPQIGDIIEVFTDEHIHYRGFSAVALKHLNTT